MIRSKWAEAQALKTLSTASIKVPPTDPDKIASQLLIGVRRDVALKGRRGDWDPTNAVISLAPQPTWESGRFAFSHEIGHAVLDHGGCDGYGEPSYDDHPLDEADTGIDYEREADVFASFLLVPRSWLQRDVRSGVRVAELLPRYGISKTVLFIAAREYKLTTKLVP